MGLNINKSLVALAIALGLAAPAQAYTELFVFGDSLSDPGNAYALTGGAIPPAPYAGTFSNGPTAAQYMAADLGVGLHDYAIGGAMTGTDNYLALTTPALAPVLGGTGIASQIAAWSPTAGFSSSNSLFMVWGGPNDLSLAFDRAAAGESVNFGAVLAGAVGNIAGDIAALNAKGAHDFFVPYLPDLGLTPRALARGDSFAAQASVLSNAYNAALASTLVSLQSALGITIYGFDTAQFMRDVIATPPAGMFNTSDACTSSASALASGCFGYLYFDDIHPTTMTHALLASNFAVAVPEPAAWMLMLGGLLVVAVRRRAEA